MAKKAVCKSAIVRYICHILHNTMQNVKTTPQ